MTHNRMPDEEYSFLKVRRSSRKINLMMKHSTPLTSLYMSSLPTVNEWEEDSYFANHRSPLDKKPDPQQAKHLVSNMPMNCEETGIFSRKLSPLMVRENSVEDQSFSVEDLTKEINLNANENANPEISTSDATSRNPKKYFNRRNLRKLLIGEKVDKWVIQQLNNIEEATQHNLVIENY